MNSTAVVPVKSAWASKINWGQAVSVLAMLFTFVGVDLDAKTQADMLAGIVIAQSLYTWIMKTWFTNSVTAASVKK